MHRQRFDQRYIVNLALHLSSYSKAKFTILINLSMDCLLVTAFPIFCHYSRSLSYLFNYVSLIIWELVQNTMPERNPLWASKESCLLILAFPQPAHNNSYISGLAFENLSKETGRTEDVHSINNNDS